MKIVVGGIIEKDNNILIPNYSLKQKFNAIAYFYI